MKKTRSSPKIAILAPITHSIPPVGYGPWELVAYNLAEALVKLGVDITLFATKTAKTSAKLDYIIEKPLKNYESNLQRELTNKHIEYTLSKAEEFDVIHNHLNIHPVLLAKTIKTPMLTTLHGSAIEEENAKYYEESKNENFVSISFAERKLKPDLNYIGNVYNGVDFDKYEPKSGKGEYFVFSGRIVKEKGILSAIELSKKTKIPLKIAGIITDQGFFDREVSPHIDNKLITYLGNLNYHELSNLLKEAIATLCLIEWEEPFGLSALDSLASGVPLIATKKGALPELLYDSRMGILVENVDVAVKRMEDVKNLDSKTVRELAQAKFSREEMAKGYLENYLKLIDKNNNRK